MAAPSRRVHARLPCDLPALLWAPGGHTKLGEARLANIGTGGALLRSPVRLSKGSACELEIVSEGKPLKIPARVLRAEGKDPSFSYGLRFEADPKQDQKLRILIDKIRINRPDDKMGEKIKTYWES